MRDPTRPDGRSPAEPATPAPHANLKRRRFLLALGAGPAAAAAATQPVAASVADATTSATTKSGYRETQHVRDYYKSARV
jgi:hypothetical protein